MTNIISNATIVNFLNIMDMNIEKKLDIDKENPNFIKRNETKSEKNQNHFQYILIK